MGLIFIQSIYSDSSTIDRYHIQSYQPTL